MDARRLTTATLCLVGLIAWLETPRAQINYIVGPQDVLQITVFDQDKLSGKFSVEADGTFTFPLIGRVVAGGLTIRAVEEALRKTLVSEGYFLNPNVRVVVDQFRSQTVFVMGQVRSPGPINLNGEMTLLQAIARAGSMTETAGGDVIILRARGNAPRAEGPRTGQDENTELIRIDISDLQNGRTSQNVVLQDGDTINVTKADRVYIDGEVKNPGYYPFPKGATVRQALALAGGTTDRGAQGSVRIIRNTDGQRREIRPKLDDPVVADDIINVPERRF